MHDVVLKLKDGREFCSPLWIFSPEEGFLQLVNEEPMFFQDIESAIDKQVWIWWDTLADVDLLQRARTEGWKEE